MARSPAGTSGGDGSDISKRIHIIELEELIVHRYSEHDALFKKADKLAREIIESNLREGETLRSSKPGSYRLILPKLKPEAGALKCSVIAEQVARAVKELNPTSMALERRRQDEAAPPPGGTERRAAKMPSSSGSRPATPATPGERDEQALKEAANRALAAMAEANSGQAADVQFSDADKAALDNLQSRFNPVWHAKNSLITAYNCGLTREGRTLSQHRIMELFPSDTMDIALAKLDATVYARAVKAVQYLMDQGLKALLIVPVHFSTVDRLRYMPTFLDPGSRMPEEAKQLIVFEFTHLPSDLTRFRLREPVNYLKNRARALIARPGLVQTDFDIYKEFGFHGVSVDLRDYELPDGRVLKAFDQFAALAEKHKLQSFVHGIDSTSRAVGAIAAGFTYIEGSAISEPVDHPTRIRPYELDMLYES